MVRAQRGHRVSVRLEMPAEVSPPVRFAAVVLAAEPERAAIERVHVHLAARMVGVERALMEDPDRSRLAVQFEPALVLGLDAVLG